MIHQEAYMLVAQVKKGHTQLLRKELDALNRPRVGDNPLLPFAKCTRIHFCRFVMLDESKYSDSSSFDVSLVFSTNFDPPLDAHLGELLDVGEPGLRAVLQHCENFPEDASRADILAYLHTHRKKPETFYIGVHGRSVTQIKTEAALRDHIEAFLDKQMKQADFRALSPKQIRERIVQNVFEHKDTLGWAAEPDRAETSQEDLWDKRGLFGLIALLLLILVLLARVIGLLGLIALLLVLGVGWYMLLRMHEEDDRNYPLLGEGPDDDLKAIQARIKRLAEAEDFDVQNQFSSINRIKPGLFRLFTQWAVLSVINLGGRYILNKGTLSDIPTIHFARWAILNGASGKRLLFLSNFDGSWERYLGDFVDKARTGLTAVWSNTVGFPPARNLINEGAADEQPFKWVARVSQVATQVWYAAYPNLTVHNILNNREIHRGLFGDLSDDDIVKWLRRL